MTAVASFRVPLFEHRVVHSPLKENQVEVFLGVKKWNPGLFVLVFNTWQLAGFDGELGSGVSRVRGFERKVLWQRIESTAFMPCLL